ncbi:hypothetical protein SAMN05518866_13929 [Sphingobium sp. YR768]|nr:hypothetical protein SAMN05518866_13929 [Sphingobium sp. YR768]
MLTGEENYIIAHGVTGGDVVARPDLVAEPHTGLLIACSYWQRKKISAAADLDDVATECGLVQGGDEGLVLQRTYLARLKKILL